MNRGGVPRFVVKLSPARVVMVEATDSDVYAAVTQAAIGAEHVLS